MSDQSPPNTASTSGASSCSGTPSEEPGGKKTGSASSRKSRDSGRGESPGPDKPEKTKNYNKKITKSPIPSLSVPSSRSASRKMTGSVVSGSVISFDGNDKSQWNLTASRLKFRPEFQIVFHQEVDERYVCLACEQVLRYPVQFLECGHHCCSACVPELLRVSARCPIDQAKLDRNRMVTNKRMQAEIERLGVDCSNYEAGCEWTGVYSQLLPHFEQCEHVTIRCPLDCPQEFEKRFLESHVKNDCVLRDVNCQYCHKIVSADRLKRHLDVCPKMEVTCPNKCDNQVFTRKEISNHIQSECSAQKIKCPFNMTGCTAEFPRRELRAHLRTDPGGHLEQLTATLNDTSVRLNNQNGALESLANRLADVEEKVETLEKMYGSQLVWRIDDYANRLAAAKAGEKVTVYSPPFLSNRHGYKIVLTACLYGDGKARGRYMSVFICLCKGDYDALLPWPFHHRLTFTLIDQCQDPAARHNTIYSITPNPCKENLSFLGKPKDDRNACFGAQKFVELDVVSKMDYVRDDTMYIKVEIGCENMVLL